MNTLADTIEELIDRHSLDEILGTMAEVCREKADHIREAWQDEKSGKAWDSAASRIEKCAAAVQRNEGI